MRLALALGAFYGFSGVALGAFGAHALRARLPADLLQIWHTAVEYQFYHALALLAVGILAQRTATPGLGVATICFALGVLLFSGSLYALALSGVRGLGAITPLGGLLFLCGWLALLHAVWRGAGREA
ncbi:Uncharacterized membrane protein YgdD, TMEM256/DUF423 family [Solimonas aquatica]|uniref:Uncharacterized membrane protein YgdD, TMEM256/DUF423 family n=1 Tax=Solimonas aquatica TaxID=489703 RepID=A0A1H9GV04_9GAMM|nr:DUF423 domain-containing protein [Solimonas aquatica]SEQ53917.1 Uncharacterized membrane protein YgdD, TMEM256/DUF423 family [Solimonas aquatica]